MLNVVNSAQRHLPQIIILISHDQFPSGLVAQLVEQQ